MMNQSPFRFNGNGGQLFVEYLIVVLLSMVTFEIYLPWGCLRLARWMANNTTVNGQRVEFHGDGGSLFGEFIIVYLLTIVTLGIYLPWGLCRLD